MFIYILFSLNGQLRLVILMPKEKFDEKQKISSDMINNGRINKKRENKKNKK